MPSFCIKCRKYHKIEQAMKVHGCSADLDSPFVKLIQKAFEMGRETDLAQRREEKGTDEKTHMYLSDPVDCILRLVRSRRNVTETNPPDIYSLMNFAVGHAVEEAINGVLAHLGGEIIREAHLEIDHPGSVNPIGGRSDILIDVPAKVMQELGLIQTTGFTEMGMSGVDTRLSEHNLIEVKATGESAMVTMISTGKEGNDGHRRQANRYTHASKLGKMPNGRAYDGAWLVYFVPLLPKGQPNVFPFYIPYNPAQAVGDLDFIAHAEKLALSGDVIGAIDSPLGAFPLVEMVDVPMPAEYAREKKPPRWPCQFCPWEGLCWDKP